MFPVPQDLISTYPLSRPRHTTRTGVHIAGEGWGEGEPQNSPSLTLSSTKKTYLIIIKGRRGRFDVIAFLK